MKNKGTLIDKATMKKNSVLKPHSLVQMYAEDMGINEQKLFNFIIHMIVKRNIKNNCLHTSFSEIKKYLNYNINYLQLKKNFKNLMKIVIEIDMLHKDIDDARWELSHLIDKATYRDGSVQIYLPIELIEVVLYTKRFCFLDFELINKFKSKYTIRLYENIKRYINSNNNIHLPKMEIDTFKKLMGIDLKKYKRIAHLRSKVLDLAIKEINEHTNISVSYELFKVGSKYDTIKVESYWRKKLTVEQNTINMYSDTFNTFVYKYLPKYANNEIVGYLDNCEVYFKKDGSNFIMKHHNGDIILDNIDMWEVINHTFHTRENFPWFKVECFDEEIYNQKNRDIQEKYKTSMDNMIYRED